MATESRSFDAIELEATGFDEVRCKPGETDKLVVTVVSEASNNVSKSLASAKVNGGMLRLTGPGTQRQTGEPVLTNIGPAHHDAVSGDVTMVLDFVLPKRTAPTRTILIAEMPRCT